MSKYIEAEDRFPGTMIIISSPSGAGKTTITRKLLELYDNIELSVSVTTRKKRAGEVDGKDYFFIDKTSYDKLVRDDSMLEDAEVFGNYYGTPKKFVVDNISKGTNVIFDIDWQGAREIAKHKEFHVVSIFILPPSMQALRERLESRSLDSVDIINDRMTKAKSEISHYDEYKYVVLNDDINEAVSKIKNVIDYYSLRNVRPRNYTDFIKENLK
ncbi:MAG: guanylate kinase [Alphaproteobacteria bacterium]|jgi:guanylate kinase|nr:guanylate kinase [Alphaproteobacteria bacterium]MBT5828468.1 guanylate kinase [Alphaproteobacteria bacterium]